MKAKLTLNLAGMSRIISIPGSVVLTFDGIKRYYDVDFHLDIVDGIQYSQVSVDGKVSGLIATYAVDQTVDLSRTSGACHCDLNLRLDDAQIICGSTGVNFSLKDVDDGDIDDVDDEDVDDEDDDFNDLQDDLQDVFDMLRNNITLSVDSHWDCYCKRGPVCGCGCDPKHEGW